MPDRSLDTSGLSCPMPILKARKALDQMQPGELLEVLATDPAAPNDFIAFCKATGHALIENETINTVYRFPHSPRRCVRPQKRPRRRALCHP